MNKLEYLNLYKEGFLDNYLGGVKDYMYLASEKPSFDKVKSLFNLDLYKNIDFSNIIILFPTATFASAQFSVNGILIDYCTYIIKVRNILSQNGIKFKNGEKLIDDKYAQTIFTSYIVENNICHPCTYTANPFSPYVTLKTNDNIKDIIIDKNYIDKNKLNNLEIMFAGFFLENKNVK